MIAFESIIYCLVNAGVVILLAPLFMTVVKKVKAKMQGRQGPPLFQMYYNIAKLLSKEAVYSDTSSWVTRAVPVVSLAVMILAALFVPVIFIPDSFGGIGNIILFLYILAIGRFMISLAGLDAGSTFGGMGSSREMSLSTVIEPTIIIVAAALATVLGTLDIFEMFEKTTALDIATMPTLLLISISVFLILIIETSRVPVDNPETHLELTMIHEGMILEYSGRNLALMELSHAVKQAVYMGLLIGIIVPFGIMGSGDLLVPGIFIAALLFLGKGLILAAIVGLFESSMAKMRFFSIPTLFMTAFFFSALTIIIEVFA
ncbi:formate hydrogenlyase subunit 4 [Methanolacinia petrolearia DSM 11571]|uniref:Formate hydrogenlyase subunit 4 n=1 Tax=Methanolacinia petrolearia (strain DSM 11571 / OCM 486 / SEBR 4847) TaxID=679926 RepID=E1RKF5_METP4|nr:NADH-quinone oxidoreductase subunit H [Methanolacinia petrolearia]ADN35808.1 formate hydrogenlyase subunit 4 [Methanolacinia petrolearia DSM 11571]